jgi:hypothetical protein
MRLLAIILLSLCCTVAFSQKKKKKEVNEDEFPLGVKTVLGKPVDSILVLHYLKPAAKDIYESKRRVKADSATLEVMSLASGADAETRPLYIHLLMYANWEATEGALADSLGKFNVKLMERFPKDVLRYFKKAETDKRYEAAQKAFQYNIGFELNSQADPAEAYDAFVEKVIKTYKSKDTELIDSFLKAIKKQMKN